MEIDAKSDSRPLIVAVDVEKKGSGFQHPIINVGVAWGKSIDTIQSASFCFDYKNIAFEKRCYDQFWSKNLQVLKRIEESAKDPEMEWKRFDDLLKQFEKQGTEVEFESDNPAYDIEAIDFHLFAELGRLPMRYTTQGEYRSIGDSSERIKALPEVWKSYIDQRAQKIVTATHWAEDDARNILVRRFLTDQVVTLRNEAAIDLDKQLLTKVKI